MIEERLRVLHAPFERRVAREGDRAEVVAIVIKARVSPRADHERHLVVVLVLWFERAIDGGGTVAVFLVPLPDHEHRRHRMRPRREPFVDGLQRPEIGVGRILEKLADAGYILGADHLHEVRHRPGFEIARVIVATAESEFAATVALVESQAQWESRAN